MHGGLFPRMPWSMTTHELIEEIDAFLKRSGMTQSAFGLRALNDSHFVRRLREGKDVRLRTVARLRQFMRDFERQQQKGKAA